MLFELIHNSLSIQLFGHQHSVLPMDRVSVLLDLLNLLDSLDSLDIELPIVPNGLHLNLLHFESLVVLKLFAMDLPIGLGPLHFLGIVFCLEVQMALGSAELKDLAVISHELHSMARIDG